jgi:hypothetical protein
VPDEGERRGGQRLGRRRNSGFFALRAFLAEPPFDVGDERVFRGAR